MGVSPHPTAAGHLPAAEKSSSIGEITIVSIGSLYTGPWEKKYWSSSRGKDRHPYPVGYNAVRTHAGNICRMEVCEGDKGPLFVITSTDGKSCSGQTPDLAWENFQKRSTSSVKNWNGKRFSTKIDGLELFGFRNPHILRLLRELVANINGTAEDSLVLPDVCDGILQNDCAHNEDGAACPDLLKCLEKKQRTGKRSARVRHLHEENCKKEIKRRLCHDSVNVAEHEKNSQLHLHGYSNKAMKLFDKAKCTVEEGSCKSYDSITDTTGFIHSDIAKACKTVSSELGISKEDIRPSILDEEKNASSLTEKLPTTVSGGCPSFCNNENIFASEECDLLVEKHVIFLEENETARYGGPRLLGINNNEKKTHKDVVLDSLSDSGSGNENSAVISKEITSKVSLSQRNVGVSPLDMPKKYQGLCAGNSVTEENLPEETLLSFRPYCTSINQEDIPCPAKGVVKDSNSDPSSCSGSLNASESLDLNVAGQELARSMMAFLLPKAVPLLKTYRRRRSRKKDQETKLDHSNSLAGANSFSQNLENSHAVYTCHQDGQAAEMLDHKQDKILQEETDSQQRLVTGSSNRVSTFQQSSRNCVSSEISGGNSQLIESLAPDSFEDEEHKDDVLIKPVNFNTPSARPPHTIGMKSINKVDGMKLPCDSPETNEGCPVKYYSSEVALAPIEVKIDEPREQVSSLRMSCNCASEGNYSHQLHSHITCDAALSESIICRNFCTFNLHETYYVPDVKQTDECGGPTTIRQDNSEKMKNANIKQTDVTFEDNLSSTVVSPIHGVVKSGAEDTRNFCRFDNLHSENNSQYASNKNLIPDNNVFPSSNINICCLGTSDKTDSTGTACKPHHSNCSDASSGEASFYKGYRGPLDCIGCCFHPNAVSSITLLSRNDKLQVCALCRHLEDGTAYLFMYTVPVKKGVGPEFVGYLKLSFPPQNGHPNPVSMDTSGLQITPDGESLVILNSIRAPYCRELSFCCPCSGCKSQCSEGYAVMVGRVEYGYVSVVAQLTSTEKMSCILVSKPNYIVAAKISGDLHIWTMNSSWSTKLEAFSLPSFDHLPAIILEMKCIPNSSSFIVAYNERGCFGLWDLSKRILLARFSSTDAVFGILPIGMFSWQKLCPQATKSKVEEFIKRDILANSCLVETGRSSGLSFSCASGDKSLLFMVHSAPTSEVQHEHQMTLPQANVVGCWKQAVSVNESVFLGSTLDNRASAIGTMDDIGIIGRTDGLVYFWELSTGRKLGDLHTFQGGVSCIATDAKSCAVAVADDSGQLLVYRRNETSPVMLPM